MTSLCVYGGNIPASRLSFLWHTVQWQQINSEFRDAQCSCLQAFSISLLFDARTHTVVFFCSSLRMLNICFSASKSNDGVLDTRTRYTLRVHNSTSGTLRRCLDVDDNNNNKRSTVYVQYAYIIIYATVTGRPVFCEVWARTHTESRTMAVYRLEY